MNTGYRIARLRGRSLPARLAVLAAVMLAVYGCVLGLLPCRAVRPAWSRHRWRRADAWRRLPPR